jgi:hypothetical protein
MLMGLWGLPCSSCDWGKRLDLRDRRHHGHGDDLLQERRSRPRTAALDEFFIKLLFIMSDKE